MLVANLPYDIAAPLLVNLLISATGLTRFCFTVQREVGDRIEARPYTRQYGPLGILLQSTCRIQRVARLPATAFWPAPAVESTMYRLDCHDRLFNRRDHLAKFARFVREAFRHRRKTLRHNLEPAVGPDCFARLAGRYDMQRRPESVAVAEWIDIARDAGLEIG
jgi:16S rRNA (adenine1518-N6/adenine1519-N6)-dimethyltransferase